jgi:hypothetical protein
MQRASLLLATLLVLPLGCVDAPQQSAKVDKEEGADAKQPATPEPPVASKPQPGSTELSAEELELLDADPRALTPEQNRKRAYALRKKVMQNPDSPQAKALEEARAAAIGGELTPEQVDPDAKKDEGLVIELPDHLQQVSKGDPDL